MKSLRILVAAVLLASLGTACSSDEKKSSGSAGLDACNVYCDKMGSKCGADAGGDVTYASAAACKTGECDPGFASAPAACQTSLAAYYNCLAAQADICASGCMAEAMKMATDCGA